MRTSTIKIVIYVPAVVYGVDTFVSDLIRGNQLMRSGKLEEAVVAYEIAIASHPSFPWSHYQLGQALEKLELSEDALVAYQKALELNPISEVFRNNLQRVLAQKTLVYEGKRIGTVEDFLQQKKTLIEQKNEDSYELNSDSDSYDLYYESGQSLHGLGKIDEAILAYQKAIKISCDLADEDRIEKAVKACQKIIELNGNSSFCHESLGKLLAEKGRLDEAIEMYRTAIKLNPFFHGFHYDLAQVLLQKNDVQSAVKELGACIYKNTKHYPSYDLMGDLLSQQGKEDDLIAWYKQGLLAMRHHHTDYQKIKQKIYDLGLDKDKIFNDNFLKNLEVISDFWQQHRPITLKNEWVLIEVVYDRIDVRWSTEVSVTHLVLAKYLQKLYGYRIAAWLHGFDHQTLMLCTCLGVEKFILPVELGLTENQESQIHQFVQDANEKNFKHLWLDFKFDDLHIGDLVYDMHIRWKKLSTPILDKSITGAIKSDYTPYGIGLFNYWKNWFGSCQAKFFLCSHATVYHYAYISRLLCTKKGIVLFPQGGVLRRYETLDELYNHPFQISQKLFLYFWNHHRQNSVQIGKGLLEETMGIKLSSSGKPYDTESYVGKKVYTRVEFCEQLNLDPSLPIVIVASHVFNDCPHSFAHRLFVDYYEWLVETLKICAQIKSVNWIVKEHPAVGNMTMGYNVDKTAKQLVNNEYSVSPNIKLAPDDLSNLSLIDFCHAILTVSGTIVQELACFGIPSILTGSSSYSECGYTHNPQSIQEYTELLYSIHELPKLTPEQIDRAYVAYAIIHGHLHSCTLGNLAAKPDVKSTIEDWANKIRNNQVEPLEEDPLFKNFMTQMLLKEKHLLRFDELLDCD